MELYEYLIGGKKHNKVEDTFSDLRKNDMFYIWVIHKNRPDVVDTTYQGILKEDPTREGNKFHFDLIRWTAIRVVRTVPVDDMNKSVVIRRSGKNYDYVYSTHLMTDAGALTFYKKSLK